MCEVFSGLLNKIVPLIINETETTYKIDKHCFFMNASNKKIYIVFYTNFPNVFTIIFKPFIEGILKVLGYKSVY